MVSVPDVDATLETGDEAPEAPAPDPIHELRASVEARLDASERSIQNQLGYAVRKMESLLSQPATAETRTEIAGLRDTVEELRQDLRLRDMEPEERATYLQERLKEKPKAAPPEAKRDASTIELDVEGLYKVQYHPIGEILDGHAQALGLRLEDVAQRPDWPKNLKNWTQFYDDAEKSIAAADEERRKAAEPPPRADVTRAGGAVRKGGLDDYREAMRQGKPLPSSADIDRMTAKYL